MTPKSGSGVKRFAWLLALPYVVTVSSTAPCNFDTKRFYPLYCGATTYSLNKAGFECGTNDRVPQDQCEWLYDFAEALNQAHERRVGPSNCAGGKLGEPIPGSPVPCGAQ